MAVEKGMNFFIGGIVDENNAGKIMAALVRSGCPKMEIAPVDQVDPRLLKEVKRLTHQPTRGLKHETVEHGGETGAKLKASDIIAQMLKEHYPNHIRRKEVIAEFAKHGLSEQSVSYAAQKLIDRGAMRINEEVRGEYIPLAEGLGLNPVKGSKTGHEVIVDTLIASHPEPLKPKSLREKFEAYGLAPAGVGPALNSAQRKEFAEPKGDGTWVLGPKGIEEMGKRQA